MSETAQTRDVEWLHAAPDGGHYRRIVKEYEVRSDAEVWVLQWSGHSEIFMDGDWIASGETHHFHSRAGAVAWIAQAPPTWH